MALRLDREDGSWVEMVLVRRREWVAAERVEEGGKLKLRLPEMGAEGEAWVLGLSPCPEPEAGPGQVITGTFHHSAGVVYDLVVEGEPKPIRVTGTHPFWSEDRQAWVSARDLRIGERLQGEKGTTPRVLSFTKREKPEPVHNLEVEGKHCYRVGQQGLLVHNSSAGDDCDPEDKCVHDTGNDPCWKLSGKYKYDSAKEACGAFGTGPKVKPVPMNSKPNDCKGDGPSYHVTCKDNAAGAHDSAISCDCCDEDGKVLPKWKLAHG